MATLWQDEVAEALNFIDDIRFLMDSRLPNQRAPDDRIASCFGQHRRLLALLAIYGVASLLHFAHNAEFLPDYPNLPESWTRGGVYLAWAAMTGVGAAGVVLFTRGFRFSGLLLLAVYALAGLDSLGHYVVASAADHSAAMNVTILLEVSAAALLLIEVLRQGLSKARPAQ